MGLHTADAIRRGPDCSGVGVHGAARVAGLAGPGEIVATSATLEEADRMGASEARDVTLKGVGGPVRVASVAWT
jgi:class 3 adenylate cyclase